MEDLNLHFTGDIHAIGAANNLLAAMLDASILHGNPHQHRSAADRLAAVGGYERSGVAADHGRARRSGERLSARERVRYHGGERGDGDHGRLARSAGPAREARPDHGRPRFRRRRAGDRRGPGGGGGDGGVAQGRAQAESDSDAGGSAVSDALRAVREHRARQQLAGGRSDRPEDGGLCGDRVGVRVRYGDGEVLRHRLPLRQPEAERGRAGDDGARDQAPRRRGGRPARGPRARAERARDRHGQRAPPPRHHQRVRDAGRGRRQPPAGRHRRRGRRSSSTPRSRRARSRPRPTTASPAAAPAPPTWPPPSWRPASSRTTSSSCTRTTRRSARRSRRSPSASTAPRTSSSTWTPRSGSRPTPATASSTSRSAWPRPTSRCPPTPRCSTRPEGFTLPVRDIRAYTGAGWLVPLCGDITQMPGLGKQPAALNVDINEDGRTVGLF